jgi:hypothetical protein
MLANGGGPDAYDFGFHLLNPSLPPLQAQPSPPKGKPWWVAAVIGVVAGFAIVGWWLQRRRYSRSAAAFK